jgi:imidazole glycerol-phosphate synthase subunit HisH
MSDSSNVEVTIVDYGLGNLYSVQKAFDHLGISSHITSNSNEILAAKRIVLPGVGAFPDGMKLLEEKGLVDLIKERAKSGVPILGICLGMQMLHEYGEEFQLTKGLGLIPGRVVRIHNNSGELKKIKIPNIGWSPLVLSEQGQSSKLLAGTSEKDSFYFVHSFMSQPTEKIDQLACANYSNINIVSIIGRGKIFGCQFHPEKSGEAGLRLLSNFAKMKLD